MSDDIERVVDGEAHGDVIVDGHILEADLSALYAQSDWQPYVVAELAWYHAGAHPHCLGAVSYNSVRARCSRCGWTAGAIDDEAMGRFALGTLARLGELVGLVVDVLLDSRVLSAWFAAEVYRIKAEEVARWQAEWKGDPE